MTTLTDQYGQDYDRFPFDARLSLLHLGWYFFEKEHSGMTTDQLIDAGGIIPDFFYLATRNNNGDLRGVAEAMDELYGFNALGYLFEDSKIVPDERFALRHPEDTDLHPYFAVMTTPTDMSNVKCFVYPYGIVGLIDSKGDQLIFRMD